MCSPLYDGRAHASYFRGIQSIERAFKKRGIETAFMEANNAANLPRLRNSLAAAALDWGATAILWIDGDVAGNGEDALKLWDSGKDIIGAAPQKRPLSQHEAPVVAFRPFRDGSVRFDGGLVEVAGVATAFCLTRRSVYEKMRETDVAKRLVTEGAKSPWFRNYFWYALIEGEGGYHDEAEDYYFCRQATELGFKCFIEPSIRPIHHEGKMQLPVNFWDIYGNQVRDNGADKNPAS